MLMPNPPPGPQQLMTWAEEILLRYQTDFSQSTGARIGKIELDRRETEGKCNRQAGAALAA